MKKDIYPSHRQKRTQKKKTEAHKLLFIKTINVILNEF